MYNNREPIENISFNFNRTESNLADVTTEALSDYKEISHVDSIFDTLQANRADNQLWKWFVILALLFVALEVLIQKFVK